MRINGLILFLGILAVAGTAATVFDLQTAPIKLSQNIGATLTTGDTTFVDMQKATQTNQLSGALTFAHATNGTDLVEWTHRRYLFNPSGANRLITLPSGWHNISGASFTITNSTMARLDVTSWGDTSSSALQTNVSSMVTFMP